MDPNQKSLFKKLSSKIGESINKQKLIEPGDSIAVGLSGGKDSFLLLESLAARRKHFPFKIDLCAIHIHVNGIGYKSNEKMLEKFCKEIDIPFHYVETEADLNRDKKKNPCFVCSWTRRKKLFDETKKLGCNKLALGHHNDDAIETMLMNMIWHGSISSMPYRLNMFNNRLMLIRPLLDLSEKEIIAYTSKCRYPKQKKDCPFADDTKRDQMGKLLNSLDKMNVNTRKNLFRSMNNICMEYLPNGFASCVHDKPTSSKDIY
jgi:tRNA 2-thiocytidine biosynthesis protein TtcA